MSSDAPWIERALFFGLHPYNSWLLLPIASLLCLIALLALKQRDLLQTSAYHSFLFSFGALPLLIYSVKDVSTMFAHAAHGYIPVLKYAYLVLGLPTLALFVVAVLLLATDRQSPSRGVHSASWCRVTGVGLVVVLSILQTLWLFEADASL